MSEPADVGEAAVLRAQQLVSIGRFEPAVDLLKRRLATTPEDHQAVCLLAQCYLALSDRLKALFAAEDAVRLQPEHEWGLRLLANALVICGRYDDAEDAADRAIKADPLGWRGYVQRVNVDLARGWVILGSTWALAQRAVELAPNEVTTHQTLGRVALADGRSKFAEQQFREALRIDPEDSAAKNNLAVALMRRQRFGRASSLFLGAARLDPNRELFQSNFRSVLRVRLSILAILGSLTTFICIVRSASTASQTTTESVFGSSDAPTSLPPGAIVYTAGLNVVTVVNRYTPGHPGDHGHFALLTVFAALNVGLALLFFLPLYRTTGRRLGRILVESMRRDRRLAILLTLVPLALVLFATSAAVAYPRGVWLTICALVAYLLAFVLAASRLSALVRGRQSASTSMRRR